MTDAAPVRRRPFPRRPFPRRSVPPLLAGLGIAAAALLVLLVLGTVLGRWSFAIDRGIVAGMRRADLPAWTRDAARDLTALGGGTVLTLVVAAVAGLLIVRRLWLTALAVVAAAVSGGMAVDAIKAVFARARPVVVPHWAEVSNYSFPSGHAANSAVVYLTLAALAAQVTPRRAVRTYLIAAAAVLVGAIGTSRVYLGVHWPTDVLAGWGFGTLWALGWWWAVLRARIAIGGER